MMKSIFLFLLLGCTILSCSNDSEEFKREAQTICSCMEGDQAEAEDAGANLNIGFCLLDAKVDLKDPKMREQINKQCSQFNDEFEDFVNELK